MKRLLVFLKVFAFWGIVFSLVLRLMNVEFRLLWTTAISTQGVLSYLCMYLCVSWVLYPAFVVIDHLSSKLSLRDYLAIALPHNIETPYYGLNFIGFYRSIKADMPITAKAHDSFIYIQRIIEMVLWWFILIAGIRYLTSMPDALITKAIRQLSTPQIILRIGCILFAYIVVLVIVLYFQRATLKVWQEEDRRTTRRSVKANYYDHHPTRMPSGCRSCGGPYPECRSSCRIFDD